MFEHTKIKLDKDLFERVIKVAKLSGYPSAGEFIVQVLEKQLASMGEEDSVERIKKKLEGLGYIS